jgi:hypothetical protein
MYAVKKSEKSIWIEFPDVITNEPISDLSTEIVFEFILFNGRKRYAVSR